MMVYLFSQTWLKQREDVLAADVDELQENVASEVYVKKDKTNEVLVPSERDNSHSHFLTALQSWQEKFRKSDHPTDIGKVPKKKENIADLQGETDEPDSAEQQREQDEMEAKRGPGRD